MRYIKKNGVWVPDKKHPKHYMGCMGVEDVPLMPRRIGANKVPKGITTPCTSGLAGGDKTRSSASIPNYTLDPSCQGAWLFTSGGTLLDDATAKSTALSNTADPTTFAMTTPPTGYTVGQYAIMDGDSQALYHADDANLNANLPGHAAAQKWAVCLWINLVDTGTDVQNLMRKGEAIASNPGWTLEFNWGATDYDDLMLKIGDVGGTAVTNTTIINWDSPTDLHGSWIHIAFDFDGSDTDGVARFWISKTNFQDIMDGHSFTFTGVNDSGADNNGEYFSIGGGSWAGSNFFHGSIYQPIIFNRMFTSYAEPQSMFENGITGTK